ncbi:MAG: DUF2974 domain-containing protein [Oscillospiraceae bacterium]|nr:DUF2974 domain-containing protein [Oscillospiraceae bacterium]
MLNVFQIERLCNIVYLDVLISEHNNNNLAYIMNYMLKEGFERETVLPCMMTRSEWEGVAESIIADFALGALFIIKQINDEKTGHRAFCFTCENSPDSAYVIFRGTSGDGEWADNAEGMFVAETPSQKAALDFVKEVRNSFPNIKELCVAGHSKGGNKAQYCAVAGGASVDCCVSVDGQGFSLLFFEKYCDIIEKNRPKIISIAERRDFVNCLGFYLKKPTFYSGRRGDKTEENPYGAPLPYFHCPDALRLKSGATGGIAQNAYISKVINEFVIYFLSGEKHAHKREKTALGLVSLMTDSRDVKQAAEAIAESALVFFELSAKSSEFREDLQGLLTFEKDVIAATLNLIRQTKEGNGEIMETAMRLLAEKLILKPVYFHYFIKSAERFMLFQKKTREAREHLNHIGHFLKIILEHINRRAAGGEISVKL